MSQAARIEPNARVRLDYVVYDADEHVIDASDAEDGEPIIYVHGYGMLVPGLEKALIGLGPGDTKDVVLSPEEGYGEHDEELVLEVDRSEMPRPESVAVGDELVAESPDGEEAVMRVVEVGPDTVTLDGNHPLAGQVLRYAVTVREVRPATADEIEQAAAAFDEVRESFEPLPLGGGDLVALGRRRSSP
jgi:FKBP-type peptidyl-prolyl cis-trans isomerase SlyD